MLGSQDPINHDQVFIAEVEKNQILSKEPVENDDKPATEPEDDDIDNEDSDYVPSESDSNDEDSDNQNPAPEEFNDLNPMVACLPSSSELKIFSITKSLPIDYVFLIKQKYCILFRCPGRPCF